MAVTVGSAASGEGAVALGNVVGSNIFNVLFILGISALVAPLVVARQVVRREVPLMIGVSVAALLFGLDGGIGRFDGVLLLAGVVWSTVTVVRRSRREVAAEAHVEDGVESTEASPDGPGPRPSALRDVGLVLAGLVLLVLGSRWFVEAAVTTAESLGVSELVIGLTIVAAGTSLPEVATSVLATIRGELDIAVGNVVGSNVFNVLAVLGLGGLVSPTPLPVADAALRFDLPVMIAVAVACLPVFLTGHTIARWEGAVFLGYYVAYVAYLLLVATGGSTVSLGVAVLGFAVPLTLLTLAVSLRRHYAAGPAA